MRKLKAEEVLKMLIDLLLEYIDDLKDYKDQESTQFQYGERSAYTECIEYIQLWERAEENGLTFDIEERYPL